MKIYSFEKEYQSIRLEIEQTGNMLNALHEINYQNTKRGSNKLITP